MTLRIFIFALFLFAMGAQAQNKSWFYMVAKDSIFEPVFKTENGRMVYVGRDSKLKSVLSKYNIYRFKKTQKKAKKENLNKTFFVIADKEGFLQDVLKNAGHIFTAGEKISNVSKKIFEPNDYGLTSTIGTNKGIQANLDYLDFLEVPRAWYFTTGDRNTSIGISDGYVDTTNVEFKGKTTVFRKSPLSSGHGISIASISAGQGDNAYGVPGVCYDCSIYATTYGSFKNIEMLDELSKAGARVINCSWLGSYHSEEVQGQVNQMLKQGTLIVAAAGNGDWTKNKGEVSYYPASYDHVISVSTVMYKYDKIEDNTTQSKTGNYFAENIKGYLGRTVGFKDNNPSKPNHIYPVSVTTLNKDVDILAPSAGLFSFSNSLKDEEIRYITIEATSPSTPLVTGTVGLMFSLYPCLPVDEVESILKMTSTNIDDIEANKPYAGKYGAGILNTGKAVEMVFDMFSEKNPVKIENQKFTRWDFKLTSLSEVIMRNQKFSENSTLELTSKKGIVISGKTVLKPNRTGKIHLKINPNLKKECELQLRDPSILND